MKEFLEEQDSCALPLYLTCNRHMSLSISISLSLIFRSPQTVIKAWIIMRRIMHIYIYNIGALMPQLISLRYQRAELETLIALWRVIHHLWYEEWHNEGLYRMEKKNRCRNKLLSTFQPSPHRNSITQNVDMSKADKNIYIECKSSV